MCEACISDLPNSIEHGVSDESDLGVLDEGLIRTN